MKPTTRPSSEPDGEEPEVKGRLGEDKEATKDFDPVVISGEPLSETVSRDRR